jgi:hypothetical protein
VIFAVSNDPRSAINGVSETELCWCCIHVVMFN